MVLCTFMLVRKYHIRICDDRIIALDD